MFAQASPRLTDDVKAQIDDPAQLGLELASTASFAQSVKAYRCWNDEPVIQAPEFRAVSTDKQTARCEQKNEEDSECFTNDKGLGV